MLRTDPSMHANTRVVRSDGMIVEASADWRDDVTIVQSDMRLVDDV